jgi:HEPN domain-containing protein
MFRYFSSLILSLSLIFSAQGKPADSIPWMAYADNDLRAAQVLIEVKEPLIGVSLYHIEQAFEKSLKAYLIAHDVSFALTHDLKPLLKSCSTVDTQFDQFALDAKEISPYATKSRYPNKSYSPPTKNEVEQLIERTQAILEFVHEKI